MLTPLRSARLARVEPRSSRQRRTCAPTARRGTSSVIMFALHNTDIDKSHTPTAVSLRHQRTWTTWTDQTCRSHRPDGGTTTMQIAIIGAGNVGTALATSFGSCRARRRHRLRDAADVAAAAAASGARIAAPAIAAAIDGADVIVLAVPFDSVTDDRRRDRRRRRRQDRRRCHQPDRRSAQRDRRSSTSSSNAEALAALLPGASVVKAFNTLFASRQSDPIADGHPARRLRRLAMTRPRRPSILDLVASHRPPAGRCRSAGPSAPARRARLPQHDAEHRQRGLVAPPAGSSSAPPCANGGRVTSA